MRKGTIGIKFSFSNKGQNVKSIIILQFSVFSLLENSDFLVHFDVLCLCICIMSNVDMNTISYMGTYNLIQNLIENACFRKMTLCTFITLLVVNFHHCVQQI